jgi:uncharacterized protein
MNKWFKKYNRRQRKKLCRGEFQEMGFVVSARLKQRLSPEEQDAFVDAYIQHAIDANRLLFGGGFGDETDFSGFVVADRMRQSVTEEQREAVQTWLVARDELTDVSVGPLRDAWHGWK